MFAKASCPDDLPPVDPGQPLDQPYMLGEAQELPAAQRMMHRAAHKKLNSLRSENSILTRVTCEAVDLTYSDDFNWRGYLAGHPDRTTIFDGHGIVLFEFRFLCTMEGNYNARPDLPPFRADFVAHRTDGQVVRMHPGKCKETNVVIGDITTYRLVRPRDAPPQPAKLSVRVEAPAATRGPAHYMSFSQSDRMTKRQAIEWLDSYERTWWNDFSHPRPLFYMDIGPSGRNFQFPFWLLWQGLQGGQSMSDTGVRVWAVCWLKKANCAGFHVVLNDGQVFTLAPPKFMLVAGDQDVAYNL